MVVVVVVIMPGTRDHSVCTYLFKERGGEGRQGERGGHTHRYS